MKAKVFSLVQDAITAAKTLEKPEAIAFMLSATKMLSDCLQNGNKIIAAGNGGSLCDAMHFAEEFTGFFHQKRKPLPAISLCDPGHMSCVSNDAGFEWIFQRGVEAFGKDGDVFVSFTTSGNSPNIIKAVEQAKKMNIKTITFLGKTGGPLKGMCDLEWHVQGFKTSERIQEAHMAAAHIIIELVENKLFPKVLHNKEDLAAALS